MCFVKMILKKAIPLPKIEKLNRFLVVGPHPDDIEIGMGATVAKLTAQGKEVIYVIATDGRYGTFNPEEDLDKLVELRKQEAVKAAQTLGVTQVSFLNFSDGGFYEYDELTAAIATEFARFKPDVVFAPDYKLANEHHIDHLSVGEAAANAFIACGNYHIMKLLGEEGYAAPKAIAYYYTDKPNVYVKISKQHQQKKFEAIDIFTSQFKEEELKSLKTYLDIRALRFGSRVLAGKAEGFRVYGSIHTHCAPEAAEIF